MFFDVPGKTGVRGGSTAPNGPCLGSITLLDTGDQSSSRFQVTRDPVLGTGTGARPLARRHSLPYRKALASEKGFASAPVPCCQSGFPDNFKRKQGQSPNKESLLEGKPGQPQLRPFGVSERGEGEQSTLAHLEPGGRPS